MNPRTNGVAELRLYERVFVQLGERIRQFVLVVGRTAPAPIA